MSAATRTPGDTGAGRDSAAVVDGHRRHEDTAPRPVVNFLPLLEAVRQTAPDRWIARCPAHEDRSPSLSVGETNDGTLLLKCWAGCTADEIVVAVGLELPDLFPDQPGWKPGRSPLPRHKRLSIPPRDALVALEAEAWAVHVVAADLAEQTGDREVVDRMVTALRRIRTIVDAAGVRR